jgi:hypothetical protein
MHGTVASRWVKFSRAINLLHAIQKIVQSKIVHGKIRRHAFTKMAQTRVPNLCEFQGFGSNGTRSRSAPRFQESPFES